MVHEHVLLCAILGIISSRFLLFPRWIKSHLPQVLTSTKPAVGSKAVHGQSRSEELLSVELLDQSMPVWCWGSWEFWATQGCQASLAPLLRSTEAQEFIHSIIWRYRELQSQPVPSGGERWRCGSGGKGHSEQQFPKETELLFCSDKPRNTVWSCVRTAIVECSEQGNSELSTRRELPLWGIENIHKKFLASSLVHPIAGCAHSCGFLLWGWISKFFSPLCCNTWTIRYILTWIVSSKPSARGHWHHEVLQGCAGLSPQSCWLLAGTSATAVAWAQQDVCV